METEKSFALKNEPLARRLAGHPNNSVSPMLALLPAPFHQPCGLLFEGAIDVGRGGSYRMSFFTPCRYSEFLLDVAARSSCCLCTLQTGCGGGSQTQIERMDRHIYPNHCALQEFSRLAVPWIAIRIFARTFIHELPARRGASFNRDSAARTRR